MTLVLDSTSAKNMALIKELAIQLGINVVETSGNLPKSAMQTKKTGAISNEDKNYLKRLQKAVPEIKELSTGKKKGQSLKSFLDEL